VHTKKAPLWRRIQKTNFTSTEALARFLEIPEHSLLQRKDFPLNLPRRLAAKIEKRCTDDPILRQFVPLPEETDASPGYSTDPVGESGFQKSDKLLHKYPGRALLVCTSACAMHCRYCFRQHYPYGDGLGLENEIQMIRDDPSIREVLLSGGDPLSLSNERLSALLTSISSIPHVKRIRIHTRFPMGIPERIDDELLDVLRPHPIWFVIHSNHPRELDSDVLESLSKLRHLGIPLMNQAVLLKGVNDDVDTLAALCERCIDGGIIPYYLHQLDPVSGAAHFEVPISQGTQLISELRARLPGYAVPSYVQEIAGESSKTVLHPVDNRNS
jgi:EF-P beta-lysylation protein EpmB